MDIHRQLSAYSPIPRSAGIAAAAQMLRLGDDPCPRLEALLNKQYRSERTLLCGSGTQALQIAIGLALRATSPCNIVALPAFNCYDVATAAVGTGAGIILYDIDPHTLAPDLASLRNAFVHGARVAVIAPLYGIPIVWEPLEILAGEYGAVLVEDAAQGHGASWKRSPAGSLGIVSTLSFGRGKGWTGGSGGAVLARAGAESWLSADRGPRAPAAAGIVAGLLAQWTFGRPSVYGIPRSIPALGLGETTYRDPAPATPIARAAAAALLGSHRAAKSEAARRRMNAELVLEGMGDCNARAIVVDDNATPGYLRLPLRVPRGMRSFESTERALACGIAPAYPSTLALVPAVASRMEIGGSSLTGAKTLVKELVTVPVHSLMSAADIGEIIGMLRKCK